MATKKKVKRTTKRLLTQVFVKGKKYTDVSFRKPTTRELIEELRKRGVEV